MHRQPEIRRPAQQVVRPRVYWQVRRQPTQPQPQEHFVLVVRPTWMRELFEFQRAWLQHVSAPRPEPPTVLSDKRVQRMLETQLEMVSGFPFKQPPEKVETKPIDYQSYLDLITAEARRKEAFTFSLPSEYASGIKGRLSPYPQPYEYQGYLDVVTAEAAVQWRQFKSRQFYEKIGFPQFAGKYEPFEVPEGYKVKEITETKEGLQVTYEEAAPPSLAEQILHFDPWKFGYDVAQRIFGREPTQEEYEKSISRAISESGFMRLPFGSAKAGTLEAWKPETWAKPEAVTAGIVGYPESLVYTGARLVGVKTPRMPFGYEAEEQYPGYSFGRELAEVATALFVWKVIIKSPLGKPIAKIETAIWEKTGAKITGKAESWLTRKYLEKGYAGSFTKEALKPFETKLAFVKPSASYDIPVASWAGWKEKLVMRITGATPHLARQVVNIPSHSIMQIPKVSGNIWQWGLTPKTSFFMVEKAAPPITKFTPKFFVRGTAMVPFATQDIIEVATKPMPIGYAEPWKRVRKPIAGGLPQPQYVTERMILTFKRMPYLPVLAIGKTFKPSAVLAGIPLVGLTKPVSRKKTRLITVPKLEIMPEAKPRSTADVFSLTRFKLFQPVAPRQKKREDIAPVLGLDLPSILKEAQVPKVFQAQMPKQFMSTSQMLGTKQISQIARTPVTQLIEMPRAARPRRTERRKRKVIRRRKKGKERRLFGYGFEYPVATWQEAAEWAFK